jgi:type III restriction enzyme
MKIHFEPNLKHQLEAVDAVANLFQGAPYTRPEERFWDGEVSSNVLKLFPQEWFENAKNVANSYGIQNAAFVESPDFTVEMETGTGKTYVYLRTIFELHKRYGLHKFFIVVPSVPIRQGTLTQLRLTEQHFWEIYNTKAHVLEYDSKKIADLKHYCKSSQLSIMVLNKQAFDRDDNILNDPNRDNGNLLDLLSKVRPIIIMDEPQEGMDTENMQKRFDAFNPLFKLRYSATHRAVKNLIYRLTPCDSYNQGLVKKIAVLSIHESNTQSNVSICFKKLHLSSRDPEATLELHAKLANGEIKPKSVKVKRGDDLEAKTKNPVYHGWKVENITTKDLFDAEGVITFTNGEQIIENTQHGHDKQSIFEEQIKRTIQTHFRRKKQLAPLGIKPLALFFIDRVASYVDREGLIRTLFEKQYKEQYQAFYDTPPVFVDKVHGGYFAQKKGTDEYTDDKRSMETNKEIYDKILKDKETLLSFDEPLEFIFSHSALGVGWDNPNIFTICTLNQTESEIKKRQELGRGLRLCVDQQGKRYRDPEGTPEGQEINLLTVVPNMSYYAFSTSYQSELKEALGEDTQAPPVRNANKTLSTIRRNAQHFSSQDFQTLWEKIAKKTRCKVHFREEELIKQGIESLSEISIEENKLHISLNYIKSIGENAELDGAFKGSTQASLHASFARLDIVGELSRNTALSDRATAAVLSALPEHQKNMLMRNPMAFLAEATKKLKHILNREMVRLVKYEPTGDVHPLSLFKEIEETSRATTPTPDRGLYDAIIHDSEVEERFAHDLERESMVRVFVKLPKEYKIQTPIGSYNPDFALVIHKPDLDHPEKEGRFYFTVETKGTAEWEKLRPEEKMKIDCAIAHFKAIGLETYLAPVEDLRSFNDKARAVTGQTFFER